MCVHKEINLCLCVGELTYNRGGEGETSKREEEESDGVDRSYIPLTFQ